MERKDYNLEIVNALLGKNWHVRALAKHLDINHMLAFRKLKHLYDENVLDFREEGKNKVYSLKATSEAKTYVFMAENYKLNQLLKKNPFLRGLIEKIQSNKKIKLAIIFGSYAKGLAKKDSDVDIFIDTTDRGIKNYFEKINSRISVKIGRYDKKNLLIKEIEKNHVVVKGVEVFYEKYGFFE